MMEVSQGEDDTCASCRQQRSFNRNKQFRFSNCCGYCLCDECLKNQLSRAASKVVTKDRKTSSKVFTITCGDCGTELTAKDFLPENVDKQRFDRGSRVRDRLNNIFVRSRSEFMSLSDWNDYLELRQDIEYDLIYGDAQAQKEAERKLSDYAKQHTNDIRRAQLASGSSGVLTATRSAAAAPAMNIPRLSLPLARPVRKENAMEVDMESNSSGDRNNTMARKLAGGFRVEFDKQRSETELGRSLMFGLGM